MKEFDHTVPLSAVKRFLREEWEKGCECPACGQFVKMYRRELTSSMAWGLALLCKWDIETGGKFVDVRRLIELYHAPQEVRGNLPMLRWWELIEPKMAGKRAIPGFYKVTVKGMKFFSGEIDVPEAALVYNNKLQGYSKETVTYKKASKNKFDLDRLMAVPLSKAG